MNERVKQIRKALHLTQAKFAEELNVSKSTVESYEYGRVELTKRVIAEICSKFNVSESWLRTGEGNMFLPQNRDEEIAKIVNGMYSEETSDIAMKLMKVVAEMDEEEIQMLVNVAKKIVSEYE